MATERNSMSLRTSLAAERILALDGAEVARYNDTAPTPHHLHVEMGPSAFEGAIDSARVVLLLANPGYDDSSTTSDHVFQRDGWPLSGLHPEAPPGLHEWWMRRLRPLVELVGAERVAQRVACLQLTPWASERFNSALRLPSRTLLLEAASQCAARGAILIVMRGQSLWLEADAVRLSPKRYRVRSWRASYLSPENLGEDAWEAIVAAVAA